MSVCMYTCIKKNSIHFLQKSGMGSDGIWGLNHFKSTPEEDIIIIQQCTHIFMYD